MKTTQEPAGIPRLSPRERLLIDGFLGRWTAGEDIGSLLSGLDIDRCNQAELLLLSCIGYQQGWAHFPREIVPRLKGLHQYYQVHNTIRLPWLMEKIHALRAAGIPVMLLKGLALRFYYAAGTPRMMADYDVAVPEDLYEQAVETLKNGDVYLGRTAIHHGAFRGTDRGLEIHCWIFKHHGEKGTDIWERALPLRLNGEDVLVMCPEDMLLHQLDNRSRDMFEDTHPHRTPVFLCDCGRIIDRMDPLDLTALAARAQALHVTHSARRMLPLLADCFPDLLSSEEIGRAFPWTPEDQRWLETGLKLQRAMVRWHDYPYRPDAGALTPLRLARSAPHHIAVYRMRKLEMGEMGRRYTLWQYCKDTGKMESFWGLVKKYGSRLRLTAGPSGG